MKKLNNIKQIYIVFLSTISVVITIFFVNITNIWAKENIPIPPKRPSVLNVSPAYINELKNRGRKVNNNNVDVKENNDLLPIPDDIIENNSDNITKINEEINKTQTSKKDKYPSDVIPIPKRKPIFTKETVNITDNENRLLGNETTLVSFTLKPKQIELNKDLKSFLKTKAIDLFNQNKNLKMEIKAYASKIEGQPYSDVKISLARALKVRSFLIGNNVDPNRIKLSSKGSNVNSNNKDRIDLIFIEVK